MDTAKAVSVRREQSSRGYFDCIKVVIGDLHLRCDVRSDRDIRMAKRLADDHGATFSYEDATSQRVFEALDDSQIADLQRMGLLHSEDDKQTHE